MAEPRTRERVKELLDEVAKKVPINSTNKGEFDRYHTPPADKDWNRDHPNDQINSWQDRFDYDWHKREKPRGTTGCNQFAGQIILLAGGPNLAGISLRNSLDMAGKPNAWKTPGGGAMPKTGDVLDFGQHIGMCYNKADGSYGTIEGGQGGPNTGYDIVNIGKSPFSKVVGWADIDIVFGAAAADETAPSWLSGWWTLTWSGTKYWYYFGKGGFVQYQKSPPGNPKEPANPNAKHDAGSYKMTGADSAHVKWRITGSFEDWTRDAPSGGKEKMTGLYNGSETLYATKLT
jgi:hypothetical protein